MFALQMVIHAGNPKISTMCCQRDARLAVRLAKEVAWERAVKVSFNQSLTRMYLEVEFTGPF